MLANWVLLLEWPRISTANFKQLCFEQATKCVLWLTAGVPCIKKSQDGEIKNYQINQRMVIHFINNVLAFIYGVTPWLFKSINTPIALKIWFLDKDFIFKMREQDIFDLTNVDHFLCGRDANVNVMVHVPRKLQLNRVHRIPEWVKWDSFQVPISLSSPKVIQRGTRLDIMGRSRWNKNGYNGDVQTLLCLLPPSWF